MKHSFASLAGRPEATGLAMCNRLEDNIELNHKELAFESWIALNRFRIETAGGYLCNISLSIKDIELIDMLSCYQHLKDNIG